MLGGEVMRWTPPTLSCQKETRFLASINPSLVAEWPRCQGGAQMMIGTSSRLIKRALASQTIMISSTMPGNKSKIVHIIFAMMLQIQSFEFEMPVFAVFSIAAFQSITLLQYLQILLRNEIITIFWFCLDSIKITLRFRTPPR